MSKTISWMPGERERVGEDYPEHDWDLIAQIKPASEESITAILTAKVGDEDGRSTWSWFRMVNGDLVFGCFPCGDTYFATETDHS